MSDEIPAGGTATTSATAVDSWHRLDERAPPWGSDAFAAAAGLLLLSGVVALGIYAGIGDTGFAGTWVWVLTGLAVVIAYLGELLLERPTAAACTAVVAAGIPIAVLFAQW